MGATLELEATSRKTMIVSHTMSLFIAKVALFGKKSRVSTFPMEHAFAFLLIIFFFAFGSLTSSDLEMAFAFAFYLYLSCTSSSFIKMFPSSDPEIFKEILLLTY